MENGGSGNQTPTSVQNLELTGDCYAGVWSKHAHRDHRTRTGHNTDVSRPFTQAGHHRRASGRCRGGPATKRAITEEDGWHRGTEIEVHPRPRFRRTRQESGFNAGFSAEETPSLQTFGQGKGHPRSSHSVTSPDETAGASRAKACRRPRHSSAMMKPAPMTVSTATM